MHSIILTILIAFQTLVHAANHTRAWCPLDPMDDLVHEVHESIMDSVVEKLVDNLFDKLLEASPIHHVDLDETILGKSGHHAVTGRIGEPIHRSLKLAHSGPAMSGHHMQDAWMRGRRNEVKNKFYETVRRDWLFRSRPSLEMRSKIIANSINTKGSEDDFASKLGEAAEEATKEMKKLEEGSMSINLQDARAQKTFPLGMIVGNKDIKGALLLAAVNLDMGGVIIAGKRGTAKSVMAKGLHRLLPPIERISGSLYNTDPSGERGVDSFLQAELDESGKKLSDLETEIVPCPFVQMPLNVMEDRLLGSVDVEESVKRGKTVFQPGLLASAHRGILFIDDLHLLDDEIVNLLLSVIADKNVIVEREGISVRFPCNPIIVATYNPDEGDIRDHILDRFATSLSVDSFPLTVEERVEAAEGVMRFSNRKVDDSTAAVVSGRDEDGNELTYQDVIEQENDLRTNIIFARELLKDLTLTSEQVSYICNEASRAGCQGQRGEIFASQVARASAALRGVDVVEADDLKMGVKLAIMPRAVFMENPDQQMPPPPPQPPQPPPPEDNLDEDKDEDNDDEEDKDKEKDEEEDQPDEAPDQLPEEFMFDPEGVPIDPDLLAFAQKQKTGKGGRSRGIIFSQDRGRYIKPLLPKGKVTRLAVDATMRAAAPYQRARRERAKGTKDEGKRVFIEQSDVRIKRMARKAGSLVIFMVDASGSMALNRMQAAKGAAISLLQDAYESRDQVCLIPFQGERAEVLLPPTKSIAMATNRLRSMPCGGGSPMAHAINLALKTGFNAMKTGDIGKVVIVAITDGRANVPLKVSNDEATEEERAEKPDREALKEEVINTAKKLRAVGGFSMLVLDTEDNKFVSTGMAKDMAEAAMGRYMKMPTAGASGGKEAARAVASAVQSGMADLANG